MHCVRALTEDLYWVGANDHRTYWFENIHPIPEGVSYNSYLLLDEQTVLFDTVDWSVCRQLLQNITYLLDGRDLDVLLINHMEPDHAASIEEILLRYPNCKIVSTEKAFLLMHQFGFGVDSHEQIIVQEGDTMTFGKHTVAFLAAPMVHWPEVMVTLDVTNGVLFSADAFGSFKALDGKLFDDEVDYDRDWLEPARRYLTNIVGKYGPHIQKIMKKAVPYLDQIKMIAPLHGVVWRKNIPYILNKYQAWSTYTPEDEGAVMILYASIYGNTEAAAQCLASKLVERGITNLVIYDVTTTHVSYLISESFRVSHIVLASATYNLGIFPKMHDYLEDMKALNVQNRTFAIIENGSWACCSGDLIQQFLDEELKMMTVLNERLSMASSLREDQEGDMDSLAEAIVDNINEQKKAGEKKAAD